MENVLWGCVVRVVPEGWEAGDLLTVDDDEGRSALSVELLSDCLVRFVAEGEEPSTRVTVDLDVPGLVLMRQYVDDALRVMV